MKTIQTVVLAKLAVAPEGAPRSDVAKALSGFVGRRMSPAEARQSLEGALEQVQQAGWIVREGRGRLKLTAAGRSELGARVGELPSRVTWKELTDRMAAAGLELGAEALRSSEALRVTLAAREQGISLSGKPTEARLRDALTWKALGIASDKPVTKSALQRVLLGKLLGLPALGSADDVIPLLAAKSAGARNASGRELRNAALQRFVFAASSAPASHSGANDDGPAFASRVLELARSAPPEARFGEEKVFISEVWRLLQASSGAPGLDEQGFKQRLVRVHRDGQLTLARADLVEAMDREKVLASEIQNEHSLFHFVRL